MKDSTRIVIILDRSGSMQTARESTVKGFNTFINEQKKIKGDATVKLVQFDDRYEVAFDTNLDSTPELTQATFVPRGGTALLDAQGRTITELGKELAALPESERPNKIIVVTLTDGEENSSTDYTYEKVKELTEHQTKTYGWQFVFLGANQDAIKAAARIGILRGSSMSYNINSASAYGATFATMSASVGATRSLGKKIEFNEEERSNAMVGAK